MHTLLYQTKEIKRLNIKISAKASFKVILNSINNITIPGWDLPLEHFHYALLELVNNSLRAHREKDKLEKPIIISLLCTSSGIQIKITDWGGGFDTSRLPFHLDEHYDKIDMQSARFQKYREINQYKRFGMGILSAKKIFPILKVYFHQNLKIQSYQPGITDGTILELGVEINE